MNELGIDDDRLISLHNIVDELHQVKKKDKKKSKKSQYAKNNDDDSNKDDDQSEKDVEQSSEDDGFLPSQNIFVEKEEKELNSNSSQNSKPTHEDESFEKKIQIMKILDSKSYENSKVKTAEQQQIHKEEFYGGGAGKFKNILKVVRNDQICEKRMEISEASGSSSVKNVMSMDSFNI